MDRLLDMGFEQTILEVLSTIRGERLPGLKEKEVRIILLYVHTFSAMLTILIFINVVIFVVLL